MPPRLHIYDVIVIGAGVEGSAAAYNAAMNGASTLLMEQFPLPHSRGSSHGQSRIIRKAYDKPYYSSMMGEAYQMWDDLAKQQRKQLVVKTGLLNIGETGGEFLDGNQKSLDGIGSKYENLGPEDIRKRYPQYNYPSNLSGLYDPEGGVVFAERALVALQDQFRKHGGFLRDGERVTGIQSTPKGLYYVKGNTGSYRAKSIIIAAGPWTNTVLKTLGVQLPLAPQRIDVLYWKEKESMHGSSQGFPTLIYSVPSGGGDLYALPAQEYPGLVKVCSHVGPVINPDTRDKDEENTQERVANFIRKYMPYLEDKPSIKEACIYTLTPDEDFIIDRIPDHPNIVVAAGFSGHGFKMAPVVGKILYELATHKKLSYDVRPFSISRFANQKSKL